MPKKILISYQGIPKTVYIIYYQAIEIIELNYLTYYTQWMREEIYCMVGAIANAFYNPYLISRKMHLSKQKHLGRTDYLARTREI